MINLRHYIFYGLLWIAGIFIIGCKSEDIIKPDKFQKIIFDLYVADIQSAIIDSTKVLSKTKDFNALGGYYSAILHHHNITKEDFEKSYQWYIRHPQLMDSLYENIIEDISVMKPTEENK